MAPSALMLSIPSACVLVVLIVHSVRTLPGRIAAAYWSAVFAYAVIRGLGVRFVTEQILGVSAPYVMNAPGFALAGVSLQEIAGWAIVAYLGWWLGHRFSVALDQGHKGSARASENSARDRHALVPRRDLQSTRQIRVFPQVLWACFFLGAIGWVIETAAGAAHWWRWTIPGNTQVLFGVPWIGIVDWAFVGIDFLLPFLLFISPTSLPLRARVIALAAFPLHFLAHAIPHDATSPITSPFFLVHGLLFGAVVLLAVGSSVRVRSLFEPARAAALPALALALLVAVPLTLELFWLGRPELLLAMAPLAVVIVGAVSPRATLALGAFAAAAVTFSASFALSAVPALGAGLTVWAKPTQHSRTFAVAGALTIALAVVHVHGTRSQTGAATQLQSAIEARDRGDMPAALAMLDSLNRSQPSLHAPKALLGEIQYRSGLLDEARASFEAALAVKPDLAMASRYLAVIAIRQGRPGMAMTIAAHGLQANSGDLELRYLAARAADLAGSPEGGSQTLAGSPILRTGAVVDAALERGPDAVETLAALAFEIGDEPGADALARQGLERYPLRRSLYDIQVRLAMARNDIPAARSIAQVWTQTFPMDANARAWLVRLTAAL